MLQLRSKNNADPILSDRNIKLDKYFQQIFEGCVISGRPNNPCIIYKNELLACYIRNNKLRLLDKNLNGRVICELDIDKQPDIEKIMEWYGIARHSKMFRIKIKDINLFVCGMSKTDSTPVFGLLPNYYKTTDFAQHIINKFALDFCEII
jgi:hypothetical protein